MTSYCGGGVSREVVFETVSGMESEGLVSDLRFTESYTRSRISSLFGPLRIRAELIKRGVASNLIDRVLTEHTDRWQSLAQQWATKRASPNPDRKERARLYRSGTNRGFSHEHVMRAIDSIR